MNADLWGTYDQLIVKQKLTMMVNRYEIRAAGPNGSEGALLAVAQQKRMAMREQVTFYVDDSRTHQVFSFKARQMMDLGASYDVTDARGLVIGGFRKDFGKSLLRSTWHLESAGVEATGQERNVLIALVRRFVDVPLVFHFDFTAADGHPVMAVERQWSLRDRYDVRIADPVLDRRVAVAMTVALDALQSR